MLVSLEEMKNYLRVDYGEDDELIRHLLFAAECLCADVARVDSAEQLAEDANAKAAVMYAAYLYEHREEADHHALTLTLRALLFGIRKEGF